VAPPLSVPAAPPMAPSPPPPPAPPGVPVAPAFAPSRRSAGASAGFLSDFSVPEAPGLGDTPAALAAAAQGYASNGPACNAYMLVYRRVGGGDDDDHEAEDAEGTDWAALAPAELVKEMEQENAAFDAFAAHCAREDALVSLVVHHPAPSSSAAGANAAAGADAKDFLSVRMRVPLDASVTALRLAALQLLRSTHPVLTIEGESDPRAFRLRSFEPHASAVPGARIGAYLPCEDDNEDHAAGVAAIAGQKGKTLREVGLRNGNELFLQKACSSKGSSSGPTVYEFPAVEVPMMLLRFVRFDASRLSSASASSSASPLVQPLDAPLELRVPLAVSVGELKDLLVSDGRLFTPAELGGPIAAERVNFVLCPAMQDEASIREVAKLASSVTPFERMLGGKMEQIVFVELLPASQEQQVQLQQESQPAVVDGAGAPPPPPPPPPSSSAVTALSPLVSWLQLQAHLLPLRFNRLGEVEQELLVEIDDRLPMSALKLRLRQELLLLGTEEQMVDLEKFRMLREAEGIEYKDLSKSIARCNLRDVAGGSVFLSPGAPMRAGDFLFRVFLHDPSLVPARDSPAWAAALAASIDPETGEPTSSPEEQAFVYLGDVTLNESMSFEAVTGTIARTLGSDPRVPPQQLMRLRDRRENDLTSIWYTDRTLKQNCMGASDCYPLVLQRLEAAEVLRSTDLLVCLRQWVPGRLELRAGREFALPKNMKIGELREKVAGIINEELGQRQLPQPTVQGAVTAATAGTDVPASAAAAPAFEPILLGSDVDVVPANAFELRDLAALPALPWHAHSSLAPSSTIGGAPWRLRHGDTVLYKLKGRDQLGSALERADVAARALLANMQFGSSAGGGGSRARGGGGFGGGGPELRIFSLDEIELREQLAIEAQIDAQRKREQEERERTDTLARLNKQ